MFAKVGFACTGGQIKNCCSKLSTVLEFDEAAISGLHLHLQLHVNLYSASGKYSQRFIFSPICYVTALFQNLCQKKITSCFAFSVRFHFRAFSFL